MRVLALTLLVVHLGFASFSQTNIGLKGGLNLSDVVLNNVVNPDVEADYRMTTGIHVGAFLQFDVDDTWAGSGEVLYSVKGVTAVDTKIRLHYVSIPLLVQYKIADNLKAELGPEISYLAVADSEFGNVGNTWNNKLDIGLDAGLQFNLSQKLFFGLRFNAGMSSVIEDTAQSSTNGVKFQNRVMQFSIGYALSTDKW